MAEEKKGKSPLIWIAIGCVGLVVVGFLAVAGIVGFGIFKAKEIATDFAENPARAAETIVRLHPDLDLVGTDEDAGTITIYNNKTKEEATLNFQDIAQGKFSVTTAEGEFKMDASDAASGGTVKFSGPEGEARIGAGVTLGDVPDWVPVYPDCTAAQGSYNTKTAEGMAGLVSCTTGDASADVVEHYKKWFADAGYEIQSESSSDTPQGSFNTLVGTLASEGRNVNVGIIDGGEDIQVTVNYNAKP